MADLVARRQPSSVRGHSTWKYGDFVPAAGSFVSEVFVGRARGLRVSGVGRSRPAGPGYFWLEEQGEIIGTLRLLKSDDGVKSFRIGRLCTAATARGRGHEPGCSRPHWPRSARRTVASTRRPTLSTCTPGGFKLDGPESSNGIPHVPMRRGGF